MPLDIPTAIANMNFGPGVSTTTSEVDPDQLDKNKVVVSGMVIDIEKITNEELYSLRKVLPRKDYR